MSPSPASPLPLGSFVRIATTPTQDARTTFVLTDRATVARDDSIVVTMGPEAVLPPRPNQEEKSWKCPTLSILVSNYHVEAGHGARASSALFLEAARRALVN